MLARWLVGGVAIALCIGAQNLGAQRQRPLTPLPDDGLRVVPFFDGWYANPDGTSTFSFGYSNLNRQELVEIPLGPDNFIEPKQFDGRQPTSFPPIVPDAPEGAAAAAAATVVSGNGACSPSPCRPDSKGMSSGRCAYRGQSYSVPGRSKTGAYQLRWPMAAGFGAATPSFQTRRAGGPWPVGNPGRSRRAPRLPRRSP